MIRAIQFITGMLLLTALEIARVYFIMPFPGSQEGETVEIAYFLHRNIFYFRTIGWLIILFPMVHFFWMGRPVVKFLTAISMLAYALVLYLFNFQFQADKMFHQPDKIVFASAEKNRLPMDNLVLGIEHNGVTKAYPIEIIGYHHQVKDTLNGDPIMITYCTVCRTGRAFSPVVAGTPETFRLVGMDHFNAMFEDERSGSWWRQVNGEAIIGPRKGEKLKEIASRQMSLRSWLALHPESTILQPDSAFADRYAALERYDEGDIASELVGRDTLSWSPKSWVIGVALNMEAKAFDWNVVTRARVVNESVGGVPIVVFVQDDLASFQVWERDSLEFVMADSVLIDKNTRSRWNLSGRAVDGPLQGSQLAPLQAYQEFWHSWQTFNPATKRYPPD